MTSSSHSTAAPLLHRSLDASARRYSMMRRPALGRCTCSLDIATLHIAVRFVHAARRPTFQEITESMSALGIERVDIAEKELKGKYRELVKKNHPDAGGDEQVMARVTVAYERLAGLTRREKEDYQIQQRMYCRGYGPKRAVGGDRGASPSPSAGRTYADPFTGTSHQDAQSRHSYYEQDANAAFRSRQRQAYWHYNQAQQAHAEHPFRWKGPFSFFAQVRRGRVAPMGFAQGLVIYLLISTFFLCLFRSYRDRASEDGWRMSESLARHEQMQELQRLRQEMKERAQLIMQRDVADSRDIGNQRYLQHPPRVGESAESRALEYARQRRLQMMEEQRTGGTDKLPELRGWPKVSDDEGRVIKRAQDPPGIVFFEPRKEDALRRQVELHRRSLMSGGSEPLVGAKVISTSYVCGDESGSDPSRGTSQPPPPETNLGSVVAARVTSSTEAREAIESIFSAVKASQEAATAARPK